MQAPSDFAEGDAAATAAAEEPGEASGSEDYVCDVCGDATVGVPLISPVPNLMCTGYLPASHCCSFSNAL